MTHGIKGTFSALDDLVSYRYPDALDVEYMFHSGRCYTVTVLDLDYRYQVWRAHVSLDGRWSLAPVDVTEDTYEVGREEGKLS